MSKLSILLFVVALSVSVGTAQTVSTYASGMPLAFSLVFNPTEDTMYVTAQGDGVIFRVVGGVVSTFKSGTSGGYGIVRDNSNTTLYTGTKYNMLKVSIADAAKSTFVSSAFNSPWGLTIDPSSANLYVADGRNNRIMKVTLPGATVTTFVDSGGALRLNMPYAVIMNAAGSMLYIANTANSNILKVTVPGGVVSELVSSSSTPPISYPTGLAFDATGENLYVSTYSGDLYKVRVSEASVSLFVPHTSLPGSSQSLIHVVMDSHGFLYALDFNNGVVYKITTPSTSVHNLMSDVDHDYELAQNYPNPFNPSTTIRYILPQASLVRLSMYNAVGQQVARLVGEQQQRGIHEVVFHGDGLASGLYYYRLTTGSFTETKKILLVK